MGRSRRRRFAPRKAAACRGVGALIPRPVGVGWRDAKREYAYGPAQGLPDTKVGTFPQPLHNEANKGGWTVITTKNDWKRIFAFDA